MKMLMLMWLISSYRQVVMTSEFFELYVGDSDGVDRMVACVQF